MTFLFFKKKILMTVAFISYLNPLFSSENGIVENSTYYASNDITEMTLKNGLKIFFKPTSYDKNELFIQLIAPTGYAKLSKEFRPSGILSAKIAEESGFGKYTYSELIYKLYESSIDFNININKSHIVMDISSPPASLGNVLSLIQMVFESNQFSEEAVLNVLEKERTHIQEHISNPEKNFEASYFALNTQNAKEFKPLTLNATKKVDLNKTIEIFETFFSDPKDFTVIVVGEFDLSNIKNKIADVLGNIKKRAPPVSVGALSPLKFPEGISRKIIFSQKSKETYSKMTIPFKNEFTVENLHVLHLSMKLLENHFNDIIFNSTGKTNRVDINYEIPFYPSTDQIWINIQFHCQKNKLQDIEKKFMQEVEALKKFEIDESEFGLLLANQKENTNFWKKNNSYWQSIIINYSLWNWDISTIDKHNEYYDKIKPLQLREFFKGIPTKNYTIISIQP